MSYFTRNTLDALLTRPESQKRSLTHLLGRNFRNSITLINFRVRRRNLIHLSYLHVIRVVQEFTMDTYFVMSPVHTGSGIKLPKKRRLNMKYSFQSISESAKVYTYFRNPHRILVAILPVTVFATAFCVPRITNEGEFGIPQKGLFSSYATLAVGWLSINIYSPSPSPPSEVAPDRLVINQCSSIGFIVLVLLKIK